MLEGEPRSAVTLALSVTPGLICVSCSGVGRLPRALTVGLQDPRGATASAAASTMARRQRRRNIVPWSPTAALAKRAKLGGHCTQARGRVNRRVTQDE